MIKQISVCFTLLLMLSCVGGNTIETLFDDPVHVADSVLHYKNLGKNLRNAGQYNEALQAHNVGLDYARNSCDTLEVIQALNNIGTVYRRMGLLDEAASWHYQALTWCEMWSDSTSTTALKNRVVSLNGIGNVHLSMGNSQIAMGAFREALKGEAKLQSGTGQAINHANIGALYEEMGQVDSAWHHYTLSMKFNKETDNQLGIALCNNHFGRLYEMDGDFSKAAKEYKAAYDILFDGVDKWHWLQAAVSLVRVQMQLENLYLARRYADEAIEVAEVIGSTSHLVTLYNYRYRIDRYSGDFRSALGYLEKATEYADSLSKERNETEIYELRSGYEKERNRMEVEAMRKAHDQENRRKNMILSSVLLTLLLAAVIIAILFYALRLRSRNQKILRELDSTKNNYFVNIAHEFRTPLTVILSAARSIRDNASEDIGIQEDSQDIITHSKELLNLVGQVLDVAKMTSGIAPDPVWRHGDIVAYVSGICERYSRFAESKGVVFSYEHTQDSMDMDFVPDMFLRIVQNLLSNAFKFTDRGGRVILSLERAGENLVIKVIDNGRGIYPDQLDDIFKPFYGGSGDVGTGVGLSVVKLSVEAMGGSVRVRSEVGKGTEFIVVLPLKQDKIAGSIESADELVYDVEPLAKQIVNDDVCQEDAPRILIVEDKPEVARWEMRHLDSGYAFYFATDGAQALKKAEEVVPDLIVTDVMMPVMDGLEFCRKIRANELLCHVPVIMVTAKAGHEERLAGLEAGADAYIEKPYDQKELSIRVKTLLEQRAQLRKKIEEGKEDADPSYSAADQGFMERFDALLDNAFASGHVDCEKLASELCIGRVQLNRKLKAITGCKTTEYILNMRMAKAKKLLSSTDLSIGDVALQCGIEDVGYFSTLFRKNVGMTPTAYRKG